MAFLYSSSAQMISKLHDAQDQKKKREIKHTKCTIKVQELKENAVNILSLLNGHLLVSSQGCEELYVYDVNLITCDRINTLRAPGKVLQALYASTGCVICTLIAEEDYRPFPQDRVILLCGETGVILKETAMEKPRLLGISYDNTAYLLSDNWVHESSDGGITWKQYFKDPFQSEHRLGQLVRVEKGNNEVFWTMQPTKSENPVCEIVVTKGDGQSDKECEKQVSTVKAIQLTVDLNIIDPVILQIDRSWGRDPSTVIDLTDVTLAYAGHGNMLVAHCFRKATMNGVMLFSVDDYTFKYPLLLNDSVEYPWSLVFYEKRRLLCTGDDDGLVNIFILDSWPFDSSATTLRECLVVAFFVFFSLYDLLALVLEIAAY